MVHLETDGSRLASTRTTEPLDLPFKSQVVFFLQKGSPHMLPQIFLSCGSQNLKFLYSSKY